MSLIRHTVCSSLPVCPAATFLLALSELKSEDGRRAAYACKEEGNEAGEEEEVKGDRPTTTTTAATMFIEEREGGRERRREREKRGRMSERER